VEKSAIWLYTKEVTLDYLRQNDRHLLTPAIVLVKASELQVTH